MAEAMFDLILSGGQVIDGAGAPARRADIGIREDRIAAIGDLSAAHAGVRRDVSGLAVAPGFIDAHTHDDLALLHTPEMAFKVSQGVTTVIVGNCGISPAPLDLRGALPRPLDLLGDAAWFRFPAFSAYLCRPGRRSARGEHGGVGRSYHAARRRHVSPGSSRCRRMN